VIVYERPVRFEDVDAAQIVFFARFLNYCHEAMEHFFSSLDGGYVRLILERRIGLPAVHVDGDFFAPLRYGDLVRIAITTAKIGKTSATLRYDFSRGDGAKVARIEHVVVASDIATMTKRDLPDDVRAVLAAHPSS